MVKHEHSPLRYFGIYLLNRKQNSEIAWVYKSQVLNWQAGLPTLEKVSAVVFKNNMN